MAEDLGLDMEFIGRLLKDGKDGIVKIKKQCFDTKFLFAQYRNTYNYILDFWDEFKSMPTDDILLTKFNVNVVQTEKPLDFLIDELRNRKLYVDLKTHLGQVIDNLKDNNPRETFRLIERFVTDTRRTTIIRTNVIDGLTLKDEIIGSYLKARNGIVGIETPWDTLNIATMGWQKNEIYGIFARTKIGKSIWMNIVAHHAWKNKHRVLFVSPEMKRSTIMSRFVALDLKVNYTRLRAGQFTNFEENDFFTRLNMLNGVPFYLLSQDWQMNLNSIEAAIEQVEPELLMIDGIYLVRCPGQNLTERMEYMAEALKKMVDHFNIPIIISSQLNRTVSQKAKVAEVSAIALSDKLSWCMDVGLCLLQDSDLKKFKRMKVVPLVLRDADDFGEMILNWNFETMDFSEITAADNIQENIDTP
jgi:replicative DNA helicase